MPGEIDGLIVRDGAVTTAKIADAAVTESKVSFSHASNTIAATNTTTNPDSTNPVALGTADNLAITVPTGGRLVLLTYTLEYANDTAGAGAQTHPFIGTTGTTRMGDPLTTAGDQAANTFRTFHGVAVAFLAAGSYTLQLRFHVGTGTGSFKNRTMRAYFLQ